MSPMNKNIRWGLKRGLKWALEGAMTYSGLSFLYSKSAYFRNGLRILTYHRVQDEPEDSFAVSRNHFEFHMKYLADNYRVMDLMDAAHKIASGKPLEPRSVCVTFDDGYCEYNRFVGETLNRLGLTATFFIITGIVDGELEANSGKYLDWEGVKDLFSAGFSIGSHTVSHPSLSALEGSELEKELAHSYQRLKSELGRSEIGLSYPYGTMRDFNSGVMETSKEIGYAYGVTAINGLNQPFSGIFNLKRTTLTRGDGPGSFRMIMNGALDPWVLVDRYGYMVQRPFETGLGKR